MLLGGSESSTTVNQPSTVGKTSLIQKVKVYGTPHGFSQLLYAYLSVSLDKKET